MTDAPYTDPRRMMRGLKHHADDGLGIVQDLWRDEHLPPKIAGPTRRGGFAGWLRCRSTHNANVWSRLAHLFHGRDLTSEQMLHVVLYALEDVWDAYSRMEDFRMVYERAQAEATTTRKQLQEVSAAKRIGSRRITPKMRSAVYRRDGHKCLMCGSGERLTIDHIIPFSQGGACHVDNFQTLCRSCNCRKHDRFFDLGAEAA